MRLDDTVSLIGGGRLGAGLSNAYDANIYLLHLPDGAWMVDAGSGLDTSDLLRKAEAAAGDAALEGVLVTHCHPDHAGGAAAIGALGVPVSGGAETARRMASARPADLGLDLALVAGLYPDDFTVAPAPTMAALASTAPVPGTAGAVTAHATPGHSNDHTVYLLEADRRYLFTGDLVFSRGRVAVLACADTDLAAMHHSLELLRSLEPDVLLPGHGIPVLADAAWHLDQALAAFGAGRLPHNLT